MREWAYSVWLIKSLSAFDFARDVARLKLAMELASWIAKPLPMSSDQVHLSAHQFAPIHVPYDCPGDLDDLSPVFMRRHARCGIVPPLVLAPAGTAKPAQARAKPVTDPNVDQVPFTATAQSIDAPLGWDRARVRVSS